MIKKVEIIYPNDKVKVYEVMDVFEHTDTSGHYLVMQRLKDGGLGFIPMELISSYKVLE